MHLRLTKALVYFTLAQNNRFSLCSKWESSHRVIFIKTNKAVRSLCILSGEIGRHINFGRELVFYADLCYNGTNKKPPLCKGRWQPKADGGIVKKPKIAGNNPSVANATAPFTQGSLRMRSTLGVWALPYAFVIQMRNRR